MDSTQAKIIELLREVHLLAVKEVDRLNMRIVELENQQRQPNALPKPAVMPGGIKASPSNIPEMLNEHQVGEHLNMSLGSLRKWRLFRKGPKFVKIGRSVRYRRRDLETWVDSCAGSS